MTVVARTAQHGEVSVNLTREHHAITVERQISVLQLMEGLEIERVSHADRRAMITVTPSHIITILDKTYTGVVGVNKLADLLVVALKLEFCLGDTPMNGICAKTYVQTHPAIRIVATEHTGITTFERDNSTVEHAVRCRKDITRNHRVLRISPQYFFATLGTIFPRHIRQRSAYDFQIIHN